MSLLRLIQLLVRAVIFKVSAFVVLILAIQPHLSGAGSEDIPGLEVKVAVFTGKVDDEKNYVEPHMQSGFRLEHGPVYLWTVLSGSRETLKALRARGKEFPVWHEWTYIGALGQQPDAPDVNERDREEIHIGTIRHWPALAAEIAAGGAFDWRTWSGKKHLRFGRYQITVMCGQGKALQCNGKDCTYYFDYLP